MSDRIDAADLMSIRLAEARMNDKAAAAQFYVQAATSARDEFQRLLDATWAKYGLRQGVDEVAPDGAITRKDAA
jgi:hypothetical protein